jgi:hypothetical protein
MVSDATIMTLGGVAAITTITVTGVAFMHIDGAFMASMAGIIAGLLGYKAGQASVKEKVVE